MPEYLKILNISPENIKKTEHGYAIELRVPLDLPWFSGHFPAQPLMPAVITTEISDCLVAHLFFVPTLVSSAKFKGPISPGMPLSIHADALDADTALVTWRHPNTPNEFLAELRFKK